MVKKYVSDSSDRADGKTIDILPAPNEIYPE